MLSLTPERRTVAEAIGPTAAKGIYALLDYAAQNPTLAAKVNTARFLAEQGKSDT